MNLSDNEATQFPSTSFDLFGDLTRAGDTEARPVKLTAHYERDMGLRLGDDQPIDLIRIFEDDDDVILSGEHFPNPVNLIVISKSEQGTIYIPSEQPLLWARERNASARSVSAVLVNGPALEYCNRRLRFEFDRYRIDCVEFPSTNNFRRDARLRRAEYIVTGQLVLSTTDGSEIAATDGWSKLSHLVRFLAFVRGGDCGIGHISGSAENGQKAFVHLGFTRSDGFWTESNWSNGHAIHCAPALYQLYSDAVSDREAARVLLSAIDYYRAANVGRISSGPMALVASYAALETLVPYILATKANWPNRRIESRKMPFWEKLRATASFIRLTASPLEHAPELQKRAKSMSPEPDPFELLARFRNRITHHKTDFRYTGREILEAWLLSQWLCEVFIFYLLGYRGVMSDRRHFSGWQKSPGQVPYL